jgi:hypothetical protein
MCRAKNGKLLTTKNQVLARWKEHFEEHLNKGSEIERALKYLQNNKAARQVLILSRPS